MKLFKPPRFAKWIFPRYTWRFSVSDHSIFLTFDDGPHPDITPFVLDLLKAYEWKATFFCVGENLQKFPDITKRIISEGHRIGNHTQKHSHAYRVSSKSYLNSFHAFESNYQTTIFRPPYGRLKPSLAKQIAKTHQIILWSWLSYDYDLDVSNATILQQARAVKPGNIIVLHDNPKITQRQKQLLPALFEVWKNEGFQSKAIAK